MDKNAARLKRMKREVEELERQGRETGFAPRKSLMRTPPQRDTSARSRKDGARKRNGTSPLELEEATRRRVFQVRTPGSASPRAETGPTTELPREPDTSALTTVGRYVAEANSAGEAIMAATSKLNNWAKSALRYARWSTVHAASRGDADKIRRAVPDNLRVQVPKRRAPLVAVDGARVDSGAFLRALRRQNFAGQQEWRKEEVDVAFKKSMKLLCSA
ncbi:unnamed protein product [Pieris brassicae]|uniref:Uncharacterized protein n=1 Tax=Pieris brassicae TaxID=7116 RepID=A0A9P0TEZ1_PIEBR|nr:unnamed protein product [Pieris brassicae]